MGISKHELHAEFPQYSGLIDELKAKDMKFQEQLKQYSSLDQEIVGLELRDSPIGDDKLHRMKQKRAQLKDDIYQVLTRRSGSAD
ncbi:MAG: YdcH family protein [Marinobacter sp.]|uniref:YdcH family protein n=1 Tax=Marinobacter sp. TaxID=50741 RepID=UPI003C310DE0